MKSTKALYIEAKKANIRGKTLREIEFLLSTRGPRTAQEVVDAVYAAVLNGKTEELNLKAA